MPRSCKSPARNASSPAIRQSRWLNSRPATAFVSAVLPVPQERFRFHVEKEAAGQAEAQHQKLQRFDAQQGQCLAQVGHVAVGREQRTVDHAEHAAGNRRIVLDAFLQRPRVDVGVAREMQDLHGDAGQAVQLGRAGRKLVEDRFRLSHSRCTRKAGGLQAVRRHCGPTSKSSLRGAACGQSPEKICGAKDYLRCRIRDRMRRFLRPSFRRPFPVFLTPTRYSSNVRSVPRRTIRWRRREVLLPPAGGLTPSITVRGRVRQEGATQR